GAGGEGGPVRGRRARAGPQGERRRLRLRCPQPRADPGGRARQDRSHPREDRVGRNQGSEGVTPLSNLRPLQPQRPSRPHEILSALLLLACVPMLLAATPQKSTRKPRTRKAHASATTPKPSIPDTSAAQAAADNAALRATLPDTLPWFP